MAAGIEAGPWVRLDGTGLTLTGGHIGIQGGRVRIDGVTASGYDAFAYGYVKAVKLSHASLTGGTRGVDGAPSVTMTDSIVTGHTGTAIHASRITLVRSTVTGNGLDLYADSRPRLRSSTCQTSNGWGACTDD